MATPRGPRKSFDSKPKSRSDRDNPTDRNDSRGADSRPFHARGSDRPKSAGASRKPSSHDRKVDARKPFKGRGNDDRKPLERKPFQTRDGERKTFRSNTNERKPFERKPFQARDGERKPFKGREVGQKPFGRPPYESQEKDRSHETPYPNAKPKTAKPVQSVWDDPNDMESHVSNEKSWTRKIPEGADRLDEIKACGINACKAIFAKRPGDVVRAYVTEDTIKDFGELLKYCSAHKKAYHVVRPDELNKISGSSHHEGVCLIAKVGELKTWEGLQKTLSEAKTRPELILILEDVGNPHNVGAIVRTAAHFGVTAILATAQVTFKPSPALLRTAEGGYEALTITVAPALEALTTDLRKLGFEIVATAAHAKKTIFDEKAVSSRVAFIIGNESRGISAVARKLADTALAIPGTGAVDSLNVSAATATLCSEFWRAHRV